MTNPTNSDRGNGRPHARSRREDPFEMPENHLDMVVTPDSVDPRRKASLRTTIIAVVSMPLFFLVAFTLAYVSSSHAPVPHDMALTVAGPASVTQQIADTITEQADGAFDITQTTDVAAARDAVAQREAVGAVIVDGTNVTTVVASAGGRIASPVIQNVGAQVAEGLGGTATVDDVAPLPADDQGGSVLFFFLVICTVGGFLSITVISQTIPKVGLRPMITTAIGAAIVVPVIGFAMISIFVDFGATFGTVTGVLGVAMLYTLTIGLIATLLTALLGQGAVLAEIALLVALNFPSAGGSVPGSMLPPFWQAIHGTWVGSGAFESMRSIMYFDGAQFGRWFAQLAIWAGAAILLLIVVGVRKKRGAAMAAAAAAAPSDPNPSTQPEPEVTPSPAMGDAHEPTNPRDTVGAETAAFAGSQGGN